MEKLLIPVGYKQTEVGVIPEDWDVLEIQEIAKIGSGTTPARIQEDRYFKNGVSCWVKTLDLNNSVICETEEKVTDLALKETCLQVYPKGTVLVAMYGGFNQIGRTGILEVPASVNQAIVAIQVAGNYNSRYLLDTLNYRVEYWKSVASSSRKDPNITSIDVKQFKLGLPSAKQEQTAIANALSDVDALIAALEKLINKKSAIKTAAMQQLLTGKKRLPPYDQLNTGYKQTELGEIPGDWKVVEFKEVIFDVIDNRGKTPALAKGGYPLIEVNALYKQGKSPNLEKVTKFVDERVFNCWFRDGHPVSGDILVVTVGTAGTTSFMSSAVGCIAQNIIALKIKKTINSEFIYYFTKTLDYEKQVEQVLMGAVQPSLKVPHLFKFKLTVPSSIEEQTAIANVLSDMDKDLEALQQRLHKTQQIKQGMMQELLTGKTRLV